VSRAEQASRFCSALFGGFDGTGDDRLAGLHMTAAWTLPDRRTRWAAADDVAAIVSAVTDAAEQQSSPDGPHSIFLGAGLVTEPKGSRRRVENSEVAGLVAIPLDVDVAGPGHADKNYPPTFEAARALIDSAGLPPTLIIDSGHGLHAWWVLAEPALFLDDDGAIDRKAQSETAALVRDWVNSFRYRADRMGAWKIDPLHDLARVMRVPGSRNLKDREDPREVTIVHYDPEARYELDDFAEHLADRSVLDTYAAGHSVEAKTGVLNGINLHELWARVTSADYRARDFTPEWMAEALEIDDGGKLTLTWQGKRDDLGGDQSSYDAALVRLMHDFGLHTEMQVEAIMCRRLRAGEKVDKVDPNRRTSYIAATIARIQAYSEKAREDRDRRAEMRLAAASGRIQAATHVKREPADTGEPVPLPPEPDDEEGGDTFADHVTDWIDYEPEQHNDTYPERVKEAAERQIRDEHETPGHRRERPVLESAPAPTPEPELNLEDPAWGSRSQNMMQAMTKLTHMLIPEEFRDRGFEVWRLERRDHGENQRGRLVVKVPGDYDWPTGDRPDAYRPGRPLMTDWFKRDMFDTPRGFRVALMHDVLITAREVGGAVKDWNNLIMDLAPYWSRDSSGSDLKSSATEWLLEYLLDHPPVIEKDEAGQRGMPWLSDHRDWGKDGVPVVLFPQTAYLASVASKPGGPKGREAKRLLDYLAIEISRPRYSDEKGKQHRLNWREVLPEQFTTSDWSAILEAAYDSDLTRQGRPRLEPVSQEGTTSRPSFNVRPRYAEGEGA
jgi:hypothetical protein